METPLLLIAALYLSPLITGVVAAYRIGASPRIAIVLAIVLIVSIGLSFTEVRETYVPGVLFLLSLSWGVTGKLIWERQERPPDAPDEVDAEGVS
jgi:hypothetical protein